MLSNNYNAFALSPTLSGIAKAVQFAETAFFIKI